jgi:osmotically-inducible protein OsmY
MKRNTSYVWVLGMAAVLLASSMPLHASSTDGRIKASAKQSYVFRTYLKHDKIKVQSKDGVVTLTGTVSEVSHKAMAEETVMGLPGVQSVSNQLMVTATPAKAYSDAWLGERVRNTLRYHRSVSRSNTDVSVTDGKVTLRGEASSAAQKELTTEYARDVSGVKDVDNQMTIGEPPANLDARSATEVIDDASITTQARMSLLFHGTDAYNTKVSTDQGVVTLTGLAKNQAEIDLATKLVSDIHGVESVNNQMTVEVSQSSTN